MSKNLLRKLPSVDALIKTDEARKLIEAYSREAVVGAARSVLKELRSKISADKVKAGSEETISPENITRAIENRLGDKFSPSLKRAVNATGVILHTGLGRALLSAGAREAIQEAIKGYCTLAADIETGRRGNRDVHVEGLLCELTGAEAATIVNNNAAATVLILNTLAKEKEVIVSRGQLVEIGGSFRMPEVMESSGAIMREVGTTNKTHLRDYAAAINENTGAMLRVHHSNYRIVGFSEEPSVEKLSKLAQEHNVPLIDDLGSGALVDLSEYGLEAEPLVRDSIRAGVDVACFSGDKLIGGPQSGIIVGKASVVEKIRKNPLKRALRVGKLTLAGMEATMRLFFNLERLKEEHPVYRMFSLKIEELEKRGKKVIRKLQAELADKAEISLEDGGSQVGSGSVPVETIPTKLLQVKPVSLSAESLVKRLRYNNPPVFARIHKDAVLLDLRTIQEDEDELVIDALRKALGEKNS
ncbi:MAG: L-seryl-tRNA(Sec) selenium transferase [Candidatus Aminicenantes bacterium]|nr:L-seryl-tRNA(Sec) selenium transferase [Candidatus Aminicenantes bacterium]